ncbi:MAG: glycosyltransferase family 1 protein [Terrimicrobiaceae bacterium]
MNTVSIDVGPATSPAPGTARYVLEQSRHLLMLDVPWNWKILVDSTENPIFQEFEHLNRVVVPGKSLWWRATFFLQQAARGSDLVFSPAYFVPLSGPPVVSNFFDSNIYEHFGTWVSSGRLTNALLIRLLCDFAIYRSRKLFVLSDYCATYLRRKFPRARSKFVVTPSGCPIPLACPARHHPKWASGLNTPFLLYVGAFSENKNQRRLIEAYVKIQKSRSDLPPLVVIGPCPLDFMASAIAPAIKASPVPDKIIVPGRVTDADLAWAYTNALAYIQPSIAEGFGLPVVEAMSYGLPVACSNTTSLPETAGGAALLFDPFSTPSISEAIHLMVSDAPLRQKLKDLGTTRWRQFTWRTNANLVASEIGKILYK